jgi:hypothetical protein
MFTVHLDDKVITNVKSVTFLRPPDYIGDYEITVCITDKDDVFTYYNMESIIDMSFEAEP